MRYLYFRGDGVTLIDTLCRVGKQNKTGFPLCPARHRGTAMAPIHEAVRRRDVEALRRELERGVDPDLRVTETDITPLQLLPRHSSTCSAEALQCFRLLLENGATVDVRDSINDTLLHDACLYGASEGELRASASR